MLAIVYYVELNQMDEAKAEVTDFLSLAPHFSTEVWGHRAPIKARSQLEQAITALRKTGLK